VFYRALFGHPALGNPFRAGMDATSAAQLQEIADETSATYPAP
jgi:hypothetical protein